MNEKLFRRRLSTKGAKYSLEQFTELYDLGSERAEDLFYRFGPSSIDLDILMAAKHARHRELPFVGE